MSPMRIFVSSTSKICANTELLLITSCSALSSNITVWSSSGADQTLPWSNLYEPLLGLRSLLASTPIDRNGVS